MSDSQQNQPIAFNVLGGELEPCSTDPMTGWYRDGCCNTDPSDLGSHTICAIATQEFLDHQASIGNNLATPRPEYRFPGVKPGDGWCVTAANWLRAHLDGAAAPVVLASTHERATEIVPREILDLYAVDVPADVSGIDSFGGRGDDGETGRATSSDEDDPPSDRPDE